MIETSKYIGRGKPEKCPEWIVLIEGCDIENIMAYTIDHTLKTTNNSAICQLYHGENKLIFNQMIMWSTFLLDQHA